MIRSAFLRLSVPVLLTIAPLLITGCSGDQGSGEEVSHTGSLSMPLVTTANGHTYRLTAGIEIFSFGPPFFNTILESRDETVLTTKLPAGNYQADLFNFTLERLDDSGTYVPVTATLLTSPFQPFTIYNQTDTTISFQFQTDGAIVTVGAGKLNVDIGVTETQPVCTILGSDCPDKLWCAPPELTGQPLACVLAGSASLGQPCLSPTDCTANASCYNFGSGAVCTGLCGPTEFGAPCAGGGTCTRAGSAYGVCVPGGGTLPGGGSGGEAGDAGASSGGAAGAGGSFPAGAPGKW